MVGLPGGAGFAPGAVLVRQGGRGAQGSYVILSGQAHVSTGGCAITTVGPGVVVGDRAEEPALHGTTVTAITLMHVLVLAVPANTNGAKGAEA